MTCVLAACTSELLGPTRDADNLGGLPPTGDRPLALL